jgi:hypothetical protein
MVCGNMGKQTGQPIWQRHKYPRNQVHTSLWNTRKCNTGSRLLAICVATPLWAKCEGEAHTPKSGKLESSETPENSERECRGQISSHLGALSVIRKVLKCSYPKWPRMSHLDICNASYGQKKGQESNLQFDSRPLKVGNRPVPNVRSRSAI